MLDGLFRRLARGRIDRFERAFGYDATYLREVLEVSPGAFHREGVPADVMYATKVTTAAAEDCGPCAQLAVTMAEREGVPPQTLRDIVAGEVDRLPAGAALGVRFARAVLARGPDLDDLRAEVVRTWGRAGLITLTFAVAATRALG